MRSKNLKNFKSFGTLKFKFKKYLVIVKNANIRQNFNR